MSIGLLHVIATILFFTPRTISIAAAFSVDTEATYSIFAEWTVLDFLWDDTHTKDAYVTTGDFIPTNNALAGINVDTESTVYVTVPRYSTTILHMHDDDQCDVTPYTTELTQLFSINKYFLSFQIKN